MKIELDSNTDFPYLLPLQGHMDSATCSNVLCIGDGTYVVGVAPMDGAHPGLARTLPQLSSVRFVTRSLQRLARTLNRGAS
jgi:hypothetical protein